MIFLLLDLTNLAVSDDDLFTNNLADGVEVNNFLDSADWSSPLDQSTNDMTGENNFFGNDLLADNVGVDNVQFCPQPDKRLKLRRSDGQSCTSSDAPPKSIFLPEDERVRTKSEVKRFWCSAAEYREIPVCSVYDRALDYYIELESTLSQF